MRFSKWPLIAVLLVTLGLIDRASAQDGQGQALLDRGTNALNAGRYDDALQAFSASYKAEPKPIALYNLGLAYAGLSQTSKALEAFLAYVGFADPVADKETIDTAKAEIEHIKTSAARFTVKVSPETALIKIDGHAAVIQDEEIWVMPGKHTIDVSAGGYDGYNQSIDVQTGRFTLDINLRAPGQVPPERAVALVDEGMMLKAQGNTAQAIAKFNEAEKTYSTPRGLAQLGLSEESMGDLGGAEAHINRALVAKKDPWIRKNKATLNKALQRIKKQTKQMAKLDVSGSLVGAALVVNEVSFGMMPRTGLIYVNEGHATLRARQDGYQDFVLEADMPKRSLKRVQVQMDPLPPIPVPPPPPPPPVVAVPPPPPKPVAPPPPPPEKKPEEKADRPSQADIEASQPPPEEETATGFEMQLNGGYQVWLGDGGLLETKGGPAVQLHLGARVIWPLSFGIELINAVSDFGVKGTKVVGAVSPGFYVRGHTQQHRKQFAFDFWGGAGVQPLAMQVAILDAKEVNPLLIVQAKGADKNAIGNNAAMQQAGVSGWLSLQSINVPLELGTTFYLTSGIGIDLNLGLTFWLPQQQCLHDAKDTFCTTTGLPTQKSFFIGGGFSFLP